MDNRTIHDLGIKRSKEQKKDLLIAQAILGTFAILCLVCGAVSSVVGFCFLLTILFWWYPSNIYYERSVTPTEEQLKEYYNRCIRDISPYPIQDNDRK